MNFFARNKRRISVMLTAAMLGTTVLTPLAEAASFYRIPLRSDGVTPGEGTVRIDPASISFADQQLGTTSAAQTVTMSNTGSTDVAVQAASVSGPYSVSTTCGSVLTAATTCSYSLTFSPTAMGTATGSLSVPTSAGAQTVSLSGYGRQTSDAASTGSLSFQQPVNTVSPAKSVTLTNTGNTPVAVNSVVIAGATYSVTHNCPASLDAGTSCDANVTFAPTAMGESDGTLTFSTAAGSQRVVLTGVGLLAVPRLSASALSFGDQAINTVSAAQTLTLSNDGNTPLGISNASLTGPFTQSGGTCASSLAAGASCTITVAFAPAVMGPATGMLTLPLSTGNLSVNLTGDGLQTSGSVAVGSLDFGSVKVGTTSAGQGVTLQNTGNTPLSVNSVAGTGDFAISHNCPASLAAGASCAVNATFNPTVMGNESGKIDVATNGGTFTVDLSGVGLLAKPVMSPASLAFADQVVGTTSSAQTVTLTNNGNTATNLIAPAVSGPFGVSTTCSSTLAANASCTYSVTFTPTVMNAASGTLVMGTDVGSQTVTFSGKGLQTSGAASAGTLNFGSQDINTTSAAQSLTLSNTGNTSLAINAISVAGQYSVSHNCAGSLAVGANCTINVVFAPATMGSQSGSVTLDTAGGKSVVTLTGTGLQAVASVAPTSLNFGNQSVGVASAQQTFTLSNTGNRVMSVSSPTTSGLIQWSVTSNCGVTLAAGASCSYTATFTPKYQGAASESMVVNTSGGNTTVWFNGVGTEVVLNANPTSVAFGNVQAGQSAARTFTLSNSGNVAATNLAFTPPSGFSQSNTCTTTLAPNASCTVTVTFAPAAAQAYSGTFAIAAGTSSTSVSLTGTGTAQALTNMTGSGINMGAKLPADSSSGQYWTFKNTGYGPVTVGTNGLVSGNLGLYVGGTIGDGTCNNGTVLQAGQSCQLYVYVTSAGNYSGTVYLNSSAGQQTFTASATAVAPYFSAANLGSIRANTTNAIWVSVTNPANDTFRGMSLAASWPYSLSQSNCGSTLAPGASCSFVVTFNPQSNVGTWNGNYLSVTGFHYQMSSGVEQTGWQPGNATYYGYTTGSGTPFCTPGAAAWGGNATFYPGSSAPNCSTFLVLVVGGGGGGATSGYNYSYGPYSGGGGSGYVNVSWANGITGAIGVTIGAGGGSDTAGGTSCFGGICAGGGNRGSQNGPGGAGGSGGGYGSPNIAGWGGSWGGNSSDGNGPGQGNYSQYLAMFHLNSLTGGSGGAPASNQVTTWGGGGGGGVLLNGGGPSGGTGFYGWDFVTMGGGGVGYGGGGGGGYGQCLSACRGQAGGGANGLVYVEWSQ